MKIIQLLDRSPISKVQSFGGMTWMSSSRVAGSILAGKKRLGKLAPGSLGVELGYPTSQVAGEGAFGQLDFRS